MNNKIKDLVENSGGFYLPPNVILNKPEHIFLEDEQVEQFATLLIEECIGFFENINDREDAVNMLRAHFSINK